MLHLLFCSVRPLSLKEMNTALYVNGNNNSRVWSETELDIMSDDDFEGWVTEKCNFFVNVYRGELFFIHPTAKEFLTQNADHSTLKSDGHSIMAERCIAHLSMPEFSSRVSKIKFDS